MCAFNYNVHCVQNYTILQNVFKHFQYYVLAIIEAAKLTNKIKPKSVITMKLLQFTKPTIFYSRNRTIKSLSTLMNKHMRDILHMILEKGTYIHTERILFSIWLSCSHQEVACRVTCYCTIILFHTCLTSDVCIRKMSRTASWFTNSTFW